MSLTFISSKYRILGKKGEGTFSEVLKCQNVKDNTYWACKKMKQHYESLDQVNNLREIQAMRRLCHHSNILELHEVLFDKKSGTLVLICELMDMNIYELIRGRRHYLAESKIKKYMYQLCKAVDHMHRNGIFHRDVKPENILIRDDLLKLADFGSCRSVYSKQPYTEYISTRWYRAPECLLTDGYYTYKMDMWSVGCVFFEIMSLHPLFPGSNEVDQIAKIHDIMGTPDPGLLNKLRNKTRGMNFNFPPKKGVGLEKNLSHASSSCIDLIYQMCAYDPDERLTARQALRHVYFKELRDAEKRAVAIARAQKAQQEDERLANLRNDPAAANGATTTIPLPHNYLHTQAARVTTQTYSPTKPAATGAESGETVAGAIAAKMGGPSVANKENFNTSTNPSRYPLNILSHRDVPVYRHSKKIREKKRQRIRLAESGPNAPTNPLLPNMSHLPPKPGSFQASSYPAATSVEHNALPKIAAGDAANAATYLPNLTQAFNKTHHKTSKVHPPATKTVYGQYQLPSIPRR